jgi:hypothetical protein
MEQGPEGGSMAADEPSYQQLSKYTHSVDDSQQTLIETSAGLKVQVIRNPKREPN